jgi:ribonuclease I
MKTINMTEKQLDEAFNAAFKKMQERYVTMSSGDIQTIGVFIGIFKKEYFKD